MKDLNVTKLTPRTRITGSAIGKTSTAWRLQVMHAGINFIGTMNVIYKVKKHGKITLPVKQLVQHGEVQEGRVKDLNVTKLTPRTRITGSAIG